MATTSPQNKAIIKLGAGKSTVTNTAIPTLRDEYMIVKTAAVALNPADWQGLDQEGDEGTISGMDFAGVVVEVGSKVKKDFKKGDRVLGCSVGGNASLIQQGAFAEFILVKGDLQFHIPDKMSFEEAATYGVAIATNALGLYDQLKLPLPVSGKQETGDTALLVYGGSTAMGTMAIQFAKLSGFCEEA